MQYILDRIKEPSTWATICAMMAAMIPAAPAGLWQYVASAGAALGGILGVFLAEKK